MYIEFNFWRVLFYEKMMNSPIFISLALKQHFWGPIEPQGHLGSKNGIIQNDLGRSGLFYAKNTKLAYYI